MRWWSRGSELDEALAICQRDPIASVLVSSRLSTGWLPGRSVLSDLWFYPEDAPRALCMFTPNLVPVVESGDTEALDYFATKAARAGRRCSSIVGNAPDALYLWERLKSQWGPPRDVRPHQFSMMIDTDPLIESDPAVRTATVEEFDEVLPACISMFTEEVGYSPVEPSGGAYSARVRGLIVNGHSFVRMGAGGVEFKAEVGALGLDVAQIQGVWVRPDLRGRGMSEAGMAAVVRLVREHVAPTVSLYVNDYNEPAVKSYQRVGFRTVGAFATIHF